jgi:hypothetical protein
VVLQIQAGSPGGICPLPTLGSSQDSCMKLSPTSLNSEAARFGCYLVQLSRQVPAKTTALPFLHPAAALAVM